MKTVAFHSNELNVRGTNVALYDYARYNEEILGNKSYIISNANADLSALGKFQDRFDVFLYQKFEDSYNFTRERNIEYVYYVKAGDRDGREIPNTKSLIHAVFQHKDVHGDAYAYISKWLAEKMNLPEAYIPYMVDLPSATGSYRKQLNISDDAIVVGRHGGYTEFDLHFTHNAIRKILNERSDIVFLFMNTRPFMEPHRNVIHVNSTYNLQNKSNFINTCDYMIHGRNMGESFGLAIGEFLFHDKPVISWKGGNDRNHIEMLGDRGIWYHDESTLFDIFKSLKIHNYTTDVYKSLVSNFSPEVVMARFNDVFLRNI